MIPRVIHQIWLGGGDGLPHPPPHMVEASASWSRHNPGWEVRVWSGEELEALFAAHRPELLGLYRSYPWYVQRADAARYLLLHLHGGVYADFDVASVRPLEPLVDQELVLAPTRPWGVSSDLMMARPGHPLFDALLGTLPGAARVWVRPWIPQYLQVMCGTGSLLLSWAHRRLDPALNVRLLTAGEYGHGRPDEALVAHLEGNSWHGAGSRALIWLWSRRRVLAATAAVAGGAAAWALLR